MKSAAITSGSLSNLSKSTRAGLGRVRRSVPEFSQEGWTLLWIIVGMVAFGTFMVYSSSFILASEKFGNGFAYVQKHLAFAFAGMGFLFLASRQNPATWYKRAPILMAAALAMAVMVLIPGIGQKVGGARRWISLVGFRFQPVEFAKFALILFTARQIVKRKEDFSSFKTQILPTLVLPMALFALVLLQPDFGSVALMTLVMGSMLFLGGLPLRWVFGLGGAFISGAACLIAFAPYRAARIFGFLDPWQDPQGKGFQILQSWVGLRNGRLFGQGLGNGKEKLFYLPEAHNDFILAVVGEELGFLGMMAVGMAFLFFTHLGFRISRQYYAQTHNRYGYFMGLGLTLWIAFQGFINFAVVLGALPTKGLPLPFLSYGGTATLVNLFSCGILLSLSRTKHHR
jgi:cell division protein FtsW